jgi:hypothetical protein
MIKKNLIPRMAFSFSDFDDSGKMPGLVIYRRPENHADNFAMR